MAYTENKSIDWLTAITPTTDDLVVTMDQSEVWVAKSSTLASIYNLFKTTYDSVYESLANKSTSVTTDLASNTKYPSVKSVYDWATVTFAKYLGDADFYKYSIVTSVKNLIVNNSFETDLSWWSGWLSASFTRDTTEYYHWVASAKIVTDGSTYAQWLYSAVTTKVWSTYAYSCYVKGTAWKQISMHIDWWTYPEFYQTLTWWWDRITGSVTATTTNTSIYIQCRTAWVTTYWVDAVQVEEWTTVAWPFTTTQWNLTVALKNYEGNDPTASKPVKIQIGGVIRTITSALSYTRNAWNNILNMWSSELATKEVDLFAYLFYYPTTWAVVIAYARIPNANTISDLSYDALTEKWFDYPYDWNLPPSSTSIVNIGRFNATLSAGAWYTWSLPWTSVIINKNINETGEWKDYVPTVWYSGWTTNPTSNTIVFAKYKIIGNTLFFKSEHTLVKWAWDRTLFSYTLPFYGSSWQYAVANSACNINWFTSPWATIALWTWIVEIRETITWNWWIIITWFYNI